MSNKTSSIAIKDDPENDEQIQNESARNNALRRSYDDDDDAEEEEEEDELVEEINVYMNSKISESFNLLQFPLTPVTQNSKSFQPVDGRIRPIQNKLQLDYPILESSKYSKIRSDGAGSMPSMLHLSQRTYNSTSVSHRTHMAVGMMRDKTLVLFPITKDILQMRPSLDHIDEALGTHSEVPAPSEQDDSLQKVQLRAGSDKTSQAARQKVTIAMEKTKEESELFVPLQISSVGAKDWQLLRREIEAQLPNQAFVVQGSVHSYVKSLNYLPSAPSLAKTFEKENEDAEKDQDNANEIKDDKEKKTKSDPITIQIQALTVKVTRFFLSSRGYPIPFPVLYQSLLIHNQQNLNDTTFNSNDVPLLLTALSGCAAMLRGSTFILKSSLLASLTPQIQTIRTFALLLLNRDGILFSDAFLPIFQNSTEVELEDILDLLNLLAKKSKNCWSLKYDQDFCVIEKYFQDEAASFQSYWYKKEQELQQYLNQYDDNVLNLETKRSLE